MRTALAAALAALLVAAAPAAALGPEALAGDPLDRAAALALPAVYRLESEVRVRALVTADGERVELPRRARTVREVGAAVGAAPGGWVVSAAHVAFPDADNLARATYAAKLVAEGHEDAAATADEWVEEHGARPVAARLVRLEARQADAGAGARDARTYRPRVVRLQRSRDLALLRLPGAAGAPVLPAATFASAGTPVVAIGFGAQPAFTTAEVRGDLEPAVRKGELGATVRARDEIPGTVLTRVGVPVRDGDSGGPVVDAEGRLRGVVLYGPTEDSGLILRSAYVQRLLTAAGVEGGAGAADRAFREGLQRLWALDFAAARRRFAAAAEAFPAHTLARPLGRRAAALERAEFRVAGPRRTQAFLLALGVVSAVAALACALALVGPAVVRAFAPDP